MPKWDQGFSSKSNHRVEMIHRNFWGSPQYRGLRDSIWDYNFAPHKNVFLWNSIFRSFNLHIRAVSNVHSNLRFYDI